MRPSVDGASRIDFARLTILTQLAATRVDRRVEVVVHRQQSNPNTLLRHTERVTAVVARSSDEYTEPRAIAHHVTMRLVSDSGIARTPEALRLASRIVFQHGDPLGLFAFRFADTHAHALIESSRAEAGRFAWMTETALHKRMRLRVPFERCRIRPIESERHLFHSLRYVFRQEDHHGTAFDLAHDGSSLPDLLGMRMLGANVNARVRRRLTRLTRETLLEWLQAADLDAVDCNLALLEESAAAAWGVSDLRGATAAHHFARRTAVHLFDRLSSGEKIAKLLPLPRRSVARYRAEIVAPAELRAGELQLRMRSLLKARAGVPFA